MRHRLLLIPFTIVLLLTSCEDNRLDIDVSNINLSLETLQLNEDIEIASTLPLENRSQVLYQKYGSFCQNYFSYVLGLGEVSDSATWAQYIHICKNDSLIAGLNHEIQMVHSTRINEYSVDFEEGFKHYKYYFPDQHIPKLVYYNSWFNFAVYPDDSVLAIGLEFFLGPENRMVNMLPPDKFPQYYRDKMRPDYVVSDGLRGWLMVKNQEYLRGDQMIDNLIWYGKMLYALDALLPDVADELKINYTEMELAWAEANERSVWQELAKQDVMFTNKRLDIERWFRDGPFTNVGNIPQDSPARLGMWMGWQIVRDYMDEHPELSLDALIKEENNQLILTTYNPRN